MPSIFGYYRPRGIRGNYIVAILLDLAETETATVNVARTRGANCGHCGVQTPRIERNEVSPARTMTETGERRWELYRIDQMVVGDKITLQVRDRDVVPHQETVYAAWADTYGTSSRSVTNRDGFLANDQKYIMNNIDFGVINLNPIQLIDWEKQNAATYTHDYQPIQREQNQEQARVWQLLTENPQSQYQDQDAAAIWATNGHQHR